MARGNEEADVGARSISDFAITFNATESFASFLNSIGANTDTVSGYLASGLNNAALEVCNVTYDRLVFVNNRAVGKDYAKACPVGAYYTTRRQSKAKLFAAFYNHGTERNNRTDGRSV